MTEAAAKPLTRRFASGADLWVGGGILGLVAACLLAGAVAWHPDPLEIRLGDANLPPFAVADGGQVHPLGTDQLGRDLLARILLGTRISLTIVLAAAAVSAILGTAAGLVAGFRGGWLDAVVMRLVDIQAAIPFILLVLLVVAVVGPGMGNLVAVLGVTGWAVYARVARAQTLVARELEYVEAARALGVTTPRLLARHLLPNILSAQVVVLTLDIPRFVVLESAVGFLGLGVQPPTPTLGNLIGEGRSHMLLSWWLVVFPGVVIAMLVIGFNVLGDWLVRRTHVRLD